MLVLSRKIGEDIVIGDNIHITVVAIRGENVRLGISAPKEVVVDRQEVDEQRKNSLSGWGDPATRPFGPAVPGESGPSPSPV